MNYVVDTSILIDYLRGGSIWEQFLLEFEKNGKLFLPTIVIYELFSGKSSKDPANTRKITKIIDYFQKIELTEKIARRAGELYRDVTSKLDVPDYAIAASCMEVSGTVVTLNKKHFQQIPGLAIYPLE